MKLFTKEIDKKLFAQYLKGSDLENQVVVAKIFNPYGRGNWYIINSDPNDPDYLWAIVDLSEVEIGSVSRNELENIKLPPFRLGLERDMYFTPVNAAELYKGLLSGKQYAKGGYMADGGEIDEDGVDLFEDYDNIPSNVQKVLDKYSDAFEDGDYRKLEKANNELKKIGYTFEYGLDGQAYDLRKIGEKGKSEYMNGGNIPMEDYGMDDDRWYLIEDGQIIKERLTKAAANKLVEVLSKKSPYKKYSAIWIEDYESDEEYADGGKLSDIYKQMDDKRTKIRLKIATIVGLDNALEYLNRDFVVSPFKLIEKAVNVGFLTIDEIDKNLWDAAIEEADDIDSDYRDSGEGIGSSDMNAFVSRMLKSAGINIEVVNNRYQRMADGGLMKNTNQASSKLIDSIIDVFKKNTQYESTQYPNKRFAFVIDTPSASTIYFRTKYFGDWQDNIQVSYNPNEDFFRINKGNNSEKTTDLNLLSKQLSELHKNKVIKYKNYLTNEYFTEYDITNILSDVQFYKKYSDGGVIKWQDALIGDSALVKSENKMGLIVKDYGRKFHLKFVDGTEKTYDAAELEFIKDEYADGGEIKEYKTIASFDDSTITIYDGKLTYKNILDMTNKLPKNIKTIEVLIKDEHDIEAITRWSKNEVEKVFKSEFEDGFPIIYMREEDGQKNIKKAYGELKNGKKVVFDIEDLSWEEGEIMADGGVTFADKVSSIKSSLLKRKKVSPKVQKDYGKTYSPKEAEESAKRIVGAMTAKERLMSKRKKK
jgi:hypothetical protein